MWSSSGGAPGSFAMSDGGGSWRMAPAVATEVARGYEARTGLSIDPRDILESPYSLIGTVPALVAKLREGRERWGINSMLVGWLDEPDLRDLAPVVEQLAGT